MDLNIRALKALVVVMFILSISSLFLAGCSTMSIVQGQIKEQALGYVESINATAIASVVVETLLFFVFSYLGMVINRYVKDEKLKAVLGDALTHAEKAANKLVVRLIQEGKMALITEMKELDPKKPLKEQLKPKFLEFLNELKHKEAAALIEEMAGLKGDLVDAAIKLKAPAIKAEEPTLENLDTKPDVKVPLRSEAANKLVEELRKKHNM